MLNHLKFCHDLRIENSDPASIQMLTPLVFADNSRLHCFEISKVDTADTTYQQLASINVDGRLVKRIFTNAPYESEYFTDGESVIYKDCKKIEDADPTSFVQIGASLPTYFKDSDSIFAFNTPIVDVDYQSFVLLRGNFSKDKNHIFLNAQRIPDVDYESFEVVCRRTLAFDLQGPQDLCGGFIGKDKNRIYETAAY